VTTTSGPVRAEIFNIGGRLVRTIVRDQLMDAGSHDVRIDARSDQGAVLSSGIYFLRITGPDGAVTTRITIAK
ncbi:MAG: T9SS type A sorting domain-containing protein, partial [Candidatus Eiseniibacteriota bacterium]